MSDRNSKKPETKTEVEKFSAKVEKAKNFERANTVSSSTIKKGHDAEKLSSKKTNDD